MNVLVVGYGTVGWNVAHELKSLGFDVHDPPKGYQATFNGLYDVAFVCVPTDKTETGAADTSIVESVIRELRTVVSTFCIRSTVPPGTTDRLNDIAPCVFQPEYYGGTPHANAPRYNYAILGGPREAAKQVARVYKEVHSADFEIRFTDAKTAEMVKYMENAWLATKVTFCVDWWNAAQEQGVEYEELRNLWLLDPRINPSHTFVYEDRPYYDSHCLNKDIPAILHETQILPLLRCVQAINDARKGVLDNMTGFSDNGYTSSKDD